MIVRKAIFGGRPGDFVERGDGTIVFRGRRIREPRWPELREGERPEPLDAKDYFKAQVEETGNAALALIATARAIHDGEAFDSIPDVSVNPDNPFPWAVSRSLAL